MPPEQSKDPDRWLQYAREDIAAAKTLLAQGGAVPRQSCYLAQQAAEKALKGAIYFCGHEPPYVHNLNVLRNLLPADWATRAQHPTLGLLTIWGIDSRYPTPYAEATADDAEGAIDQAQAVYDSVARDMAERGWIANL